MSQIGFQESNISLEEMLVQIAENNGIKSFALPVYVQGIHPWEYAELSRDRINRFSRTIYVTPEELEKGKVILEELYRHEDEVVGISSRVGLLDGRYAHLKHIDWDNIAHFAFDENYRLKEFRKTLSHLGEHLSNLRKGLSPFQYRQFHLPNIDEVRSDSRKGFIIKSGGGFHYHGLQVIDDRNWVKWIKGLKQIERVDSDWCNVQLKREYSILRMTSSSIKGFSPEVVYGVRVED
jgi:hypothetical protein